MKKRLLHLFSFLIIALYFSSCRTTAPSLNYKELAHASIQLGMNINMEDNHKLYIEVANWIGVPYRPAGNTKQGIDCSGFTAQVYKKVYKKTLERSTDEQKNKNCKKISKSDLQEGDLVFFTSRSTNEVAHVGIYLKENKFAHASTSKGVIVSSLNEKYYTTHWLCGGKVKE